MVLPAATAKMFCELAEENEIVHTVVSNGLSCREGHPLPLRQSVLDVWLFGGAIVGEFQPPEFEINVLEVALYVLSITGNGLTLKE